MTLVVAVTTEDGGWMGGDRLAGDDPYVELAGPKVFELDTPDQVPFLIGFAGSPRVAQTIIATTPPKRETETYSLRWWLTEYADAIRERCEAMSLLMDPGDGSPAHLADHTHALVVIEGRVFKYGSGLSWEEPARGWAAIGCAFETFCGAYLALSDDGQDQIDAARQAWPIAQRFHHIGRLADELDLASQA